MDFKDYKSTVNELFRYLWGGIFLYASWKIFKVQVPAPFQIEVSNFHLENPYALLVFSFLVGALLYSLYRAILLPFIDMVHMKVHNEKECLLRLVAKHINSRNHANIINVYRHIRNNDEYFHREMRVLTYQQRTEVHLLYLSSFILLLVTAVKFLNLFPDLDMLKANLGLLLFMLMVAVLMFLFGMRIDLDICHQERYHIRPKQESLEEYIKLYFSTEKEAQERTGKKLKKFIKGLVKKQR